MKYILSFLILLSFGQAIGQTYNCSSEYPAFKDFYCKLENQTTIFWSKGNGTVGDWHTSSTWEGGIIPTENSIVIIRKNDVVTITDETANIKLLDVWGALHMAHDVTTKLNVETMQVISGGGEFHIGSPSDPVDDGVTATVNFTHDNSTIDENYDPRRISRGLLAYGTAVIRVYGKSKTSKIRIGDAFSDTGVIPTIDAVPSDWEEGDLLVIPGTVFQRNANFELEDELKYIASFSTNSITVDSDFEHNHVRIHKDASSLFDLHLANLSRNVIFKTDNPQPHISNNIMHRRGHIMFMGKGDVIIENALFKDLGRTNKARPLNDYKITGPNTYTEGTNKNTRGRYALHFHQNNHSYTNSDLINKIQNNNMAQVKGCVVWGTPGWGFVNHSSYVNFDDNVAYDFVGSGFVTESGDEIGNFTNNIAIGGRGEKQYRDIRLVFNNHERPLPLSDFGFSGDGFWFQGPMIRVTDNIAASCNGAGMIWFTIGGLELNLDPEPGDPNMQFYGVKIPLAQEIYGGLNGGAGYEFDKDGSCTGEDIKYLKKYHFNGFVGPMFQPRKWSYNDQIFLADLPIIECSGFKAYGCLAGFRIRFNNAPSNFIFNDFGANYFTYNDYLIDTDGSGDHRSASRVYQSISNLRLWNNETGFRNRYSTNTNVSDVIIRNEVRYDHIIPKKGLETDHRVENYYYCNTHVSGYALANDVLEDFPENDCDLYAATFGEGCDVSESVMQIFDNFGVFCPEPQDVRITGFEFNALLEANDVTISWQENNLIDRIGLRYKKRDDLYWSYLWEDVASGTNSIELNNGEIENGFLYDYQLISGCYEYDSPGNSVIGNYLPYVNAANPDGSACGFDPDLFASTYGDVDVDSTHYGKIGKNSNWTNNLIFPCEYLECNSKVGFSLTWNTNDCEIAACNNESVYLKYTDNSGNTISITNWVGPNGSIPNSYNNNGVLYISQVGPDGYGSYHGSYINANGVKSITQPIQISPAASFPGNIGYVDGGGVLHPTDIIYTCLDKDLQLRASYPNSTIQWYDEKGNLLSNSSDLFIEGDNDISNPLPLTEKLSYYQTYTARITDASNCVFDVNIEVAPEGNMICRSYKDREIDTNLYPLKPQPEWEDNLDCSITHCDDTELKLRMFYEENGPSSTWYYPIEPIEGDYTLDLDCDDCGDCQDSICDCSLLSATFTIPSGTDFYIVIPGTDQNAFQFREIPIIKIPKDESGVPLDIDIEYIDGAGMQQTITLSCLKTLDLSLFGSNGYGTYFVEINDYEGCTTIREFDLIDCPARESNTEFHDFEDINNSLLKIYPNPTKGNSTLQLSFFTTEQEKTFFIFDMGGRLLQTEKFRTQTGENLKQIDVSRLPSGMYFISDGHRLYSKLIVI